MMCPPLPGEKTPRLALPTAQGESFDLFAECPPNFTMIVFYCGFHCPMCEKQLSELDSKIEEFIDLGVSVVAVSMDDRARAEATQSEWKINNIRFGYALSLVSACEWGLFVSEAINENEPRRFLEPAIVFVRPNGELFATFLQSAPFARPRTDDLIDGIRFIIKNDYPTRGTLGHEGDERIAATA